MVKMNIFEKQKSDEKSKNTIDIIEANQSFNEKELSELLETMKNEMRGLTYRELTEVISYVKKIK